MSPCLPPSARFGDLFAHVQQARLYPDSKTFADAIPRRPLADILADWAGAEPLLGEDLRAFVEANFLLPDTADMTAPSGLALDPYIRALWDMLVRSSGPARGSEISLPEPYVVPGGRFRELYYWDSYFTMLGLARSGRQDLVEQMIVDFGSLLERFGHIPNGTRSYYLSRSHPPFFHLMASLSARQDESSRRQRLRWMRIEHDFWMDGADTLPPGHQHRRVVRLPDGSLLNRYWDDLDQPRDESWGEDVELAAEAEQSAPTLWRNLRAAAESGWDFSSRWLAAQSDLGTIRTTRIVPVDLNCLLHGLEQAIAAESAALGEPEFATVFSRRADARAGAIAAHLWNEDTGYYADHDLDSGAVSPQLTAAAAFPLFFRLSDPQRATRNAQALQQLLRPGGLMTTLVETGQQWDAPNGWAPLQWIAVAGLRHYGENALADEIARRWLSMVEDSFAETGQLFEKYDVAQRSAGGGGEYGTVTGFGWTNGVTQELRAGRG
ncbi:MAG: trehalase [Sphingomonas sp.]|nr:MAG: trehalase [Sphingomonas sp.]